MAIFECMVVILGIILLIVGLRVKPNTNNKLVVVIGLFTIGVVSITIGEVALLSRYIPDVIVGNFIINHVLIVFLLSLITIFILLLWLAYLVRKWTRIIRSEV